MKLRLRVLYCSRSNILDGPSDTIDWKLIVMQLASTSIVLTSLRRRLLLVHRWCNLFFPQLDVIKYRCRATKSSQQKMLWCRPLRGPRDRLGLLSVVLRLLEVGHIQNSLDLLWLESGWKGAVSEDQTAFNWCLELTKVLSGCIVCGQYIVCAMRFRCSSPTATTW